MSIGQDAGEGTVTAARIFEMKGMKYTVLTFTDPQGFPFRQSTMSSIQYWQPMSSKSSSFSPAVASSASTCSLVVVMYLSLCSVPTPIYTSPIKKKSTSHEVLFYLWSTHTGILTKYSREDARYFVRPRKQGVYSRPCFLKYSCGGGAGNWTPVRIWL